MKIRSILALAFLFSLASCSTEQSFESAVDQNSLPNVKNSSGSLVKKEATAPLKTEAGEMIIVPQIDLSVWSKVDDEDGIQTYQKKESNDGLVAFRGEVMIPTPLIKIAAVFDDSSTRKDWIDSLVESKVLREKGRLYRVEYNHTKVPWPFQNRDFVYSVNTEFVKNPKTMVIKMKSIDDPAAPPINGRVRGKIDYCYYYIQEVEADKQSKLVVEMSVDPMGSIPKWLVNLTQKNWPHNTLSGLRKVAQRKDLKIQKDLIQYFAVPTQQKGKNEKSN